MIRSFASKGLRFVRHNSTLKRPLKVLDDYDRQHRIAKYPNFPFIKLIAGTVVVGSTSFGLYYVFKKPINNILSSETANVLASDKVKNSIKDTINVLSEDPEIRKQLKTFVIDNFNDIIQEEIFRNMLKKMGSDLVADLCDDPKIIDKVTDLVIVVLNKQIVMNELKIIIDKLCNDDHNKKSIGYLLKESITSDEMMQTWKTTIRQLVKDTFNFWN